MRPSGRCAPPVDVESGRLDKWRRKDVGVRERARRIGVRARVSLPRRCAELAASYSGEGSAVAVSASAITVSARFIAALSSPLCHSSTDWPSSNDRSLASCARETSSRSATMASTSSLASASFWADRIIFLPLSHRNYGPSGSMVTTCVLANLRRLVRACLVDDASRGRGGSPAPREQFLETVDAISVDHAIRPNRAIERWECRP
jgi:hypothetical protein